MALEITLGKAAIEGEFYAAAEHVYVTKDGAVVSDTDPNVHMLLVAKGQRIPLSLAQQYGLVKESASETTETTEKGVTEPAETKAVKPQRNK